MKTLVLIRGWASVGHSFKKLVISTPKDWQVVLIGADELIKNHDFDQAADNLEKIIKQKKITDFILAGHSLGGAVAIAYSAKYPYSHSKLILINTAGFPLPGSFYPETLKMFFRNSKKTVSHFSLKVREAMNLLKNPYFHLKLGKFAREANIIYLAGKVTKPVLILYGNQDLLIPLQVAQEIKQSLPNARLKILKDLDHDWIQTHPDIFWQEMKQISG